MTVNNDIDDDSATKHGDSHRFHRSCLSTLSLDTVKDVMGGEVDELEEDVG